MDKQSIEVSELEALGWAIKDRTYGYGNHPIIIMVNSSGTCVVSINTQGDKNFIPAYKYN